MKQLTKNIRKDIKELIEKVGGTDKITNHQVSQLIEKYKNITGLEFGIPTAVQNQINYFRYGKGL